MAIKQVPVIYEVLKQTPGEPSSTDAYAELATALRNAAGQGQPATRQRG